MCSPLLREMKAMSIIVICAVYDWDDLAFHASEAASDYHSLRVQSFPATGPESKEASALLKTLSLRITLFRVCRGCACMRSCFDQQLKIWTCNRLLCGEVSSLSFKLFLVVFMRGHQPRPPPLLPSLCLILFRLLVFIKLFLNFVYLFFFFFPFLMRFRPAVVCFFSLSSLIPSLSVFVDNEPWWPWRPALFYGDTTPLKHWKWKKRKNVFSQWAITVQLFKFFCTTLNILNVRKVMVQYT